MRYFLFMLGRQDYLQNAKILFGSKDCSGKRERAVWYFLQGSDTTIGLLTLSVVALTMMEVHPSILRWRYQRAAADGAHCCAIFLCWLAGEIQGHPERMRKLKQFFIGNNFYKNNWDLRSRISASLNIEVKVSVSHSRWCSTDMIGLHHPSVNTKKKTKTKTNHPLQRQGHVQPQTQS